MNERTYTYYRPEWTCGRYIKSAGAALYYNLIEGVSYFFEDDSAEIIGEIIAIDRNQIVSVEKISEKTNTAIESLIPFFEQLYGLGLLIKTPLTSISLVKYRDAMSRWKKEHPIKLDASTKKKLPIVQSNAESAFAAKVGGITSVMFELTYNCSEKCIHCYNIGATRNDEEKSHRAETTTLSIEEYKDCIDQLYALGLAKVCLSGGDPFSNPLAWEIIEYLYNENIAFDVFTNGLSIVDKVDLLASYYPRLVGVSIYSDKPEVHDYITRIPGSWKRSMAVVKRLGELSVPLNVKCCIMRPNFKSYRGVVDIARRNGAQPQFEINVTDSIEGDKCVSRYLRMTPRQYEIVLRDDNIPQYVGPEAPDFGAVERDMNHNSCGAGDTSFCLTPNGDLIACCSFHLVFGNIKESSVDEILRSETLHQWRNIGLKDYAECGKHDYCAYCNLCAGLAYSEHGDYKQPSEHGCYVAKIRYELAQKMKNGYDPLDGMKLEEVIEDSDNYDYIKLHRVL